MTQRLPPDGRPPTIHEVERFTEHGSKLCGAAIGRFAKPFRSLIVAEGGEFGNSSMTTTADALQLGYEHHRNGRLEEAERLYRQVLNTEPENPHALHLLGVVAHQRGQHAAAVELIGRAIAQDAMQFTFHANLASAYLALGRAELAIGAMQNVVRLQPDHVKTYNDLGVLLANLGRIAEATACFERVLQLQPQHAASHNNLGNILNQQDRRREAIDCFRAAIRLNPDLLQAYSNLGNVLKAEGRVDEAIEQYRNALRIDANYAEGYYNLAHTLGSLDKPDEAIAAYREALRVRPDFVEARFNLGGIYKGQGLLAEALEALEIVVDQRPNFPEGHFRLAGVLHAQGKFARARAALDESIRLKPSLVEAHQALGNLLRDQGQLEPAIASYHEALRHNPAFIEAHNNLASALRSLRRFDEAEKVCRRALAIDPTNADLHCNLGLVLQDLGRTAEAIVSQTEALRLRPEFAAAHNALGVALESQGELDRALVQLRRAVQLEPNFAEAYNNLGSVLREQGKYGETLICFEEALRINANLAEAHNNFGTALQLNAQSEEALAAFRQAIELKPDFAEAHDNIGTLLSGQRDFDAAMSSFDRALHLRPTMVSARVNRAITHLLLGDFAAGWPEYEWRWKLPEAPARPWARPIWDGSPLEGRTIMLHPEQGLGDMLQFIRYAPLVKARGGKVLLAAPKKMAPILSTCAGIDLLISESDPPVGFDVRAALVSLPGVFRTDLASIPAQVPYLFAEPDLVTRFGELLAGDDRFRVGINWQGNPKYHGDQFRSIPLAEFAPLAEIEGVRLLSLQQGFGIEQLAKTEFAVEAGAVEDWGSKLDVDGRAFCDTAAVIANLDLVITSDTAVAHVAGALGALVWLALPFTPDWRWLLDRPDSPWYPTMRLFRQPSAGDWNSVFAEIAAELAAVVAERKR